MSELTIRQYRPADEDAVWDLHERALRDVGAYDEEFAHLDADLRNVRAAYLDAGGAFIVGTVDDEIVAMGALQPSTAVDHHRSDPDTGVVRRMRVDPDHQRRGYGRRILATLEARSRDREFERLTLDTGVDQEAARGLYEAFGYREVRRESTPAGEMMFYEKRL